MVIEIKPVFFRSFLLFLFFLDFLSFLFSFFFFWFRGPVCFWSMSVDTVKRVSKVALKENFGGLWFVEEVAWRGFFFDSFCD